MDATEQIENINKEMRSKIMPIVEEYVIHSSVKRNLEKVYFAAEETIEKIAHLLIENNKEIKNNVEDCKKNFMERANVYVKEKYWFITPVTAVIVGLLLTIWTLYAVQVNNLAMKVDRLNEVSVKKDQMNELTDKIDTLYKLIYTAIK